MISEILQIRGTDRRRELRREETISALVGGKKLNLRKCQRAVIENLGSGGLRIRTGSPLKLNQRVFLYDRNGKLLYPVRVVWSRNDAKKIGQAFISGCELLSPVGPETRGIPMVIVGAVSWGRILGLAAIVTLLAAAAYLAYPFLAMI